MNLEVYYYDITIRLVALTTLSLILSGLYLKYITHPRNHSFLKQEKTIYAMQIIFWILFLSNILAKVLPVNIFGFFSFELIILSIIFISFTFLLWKWFKKNTLDLGILYSTLPLIMLFILSLGMD